MIRHQNQKEKRRCDPYLDRRSGDDRRMFYAIAYFLDGGRERRGEQERRSLFERRADCVRVTRWSSVCAESHR